MKIGFDAKRYFNNQTGLGNYARWLVDGLANQSKNELHLYHTKPEKNDLAVHTPNGLSKYFSSLWRSRNIVKDLVSDKIEVYHGLSNEIPYGIHRTAIKAVVTIHDLINFRYPEYYNFIDRLIYKLKLKYAVKYADTIIVPSLHTKDDLITILDTKSDKIRVIPLSVKPRRSYSKLEFAYSPVNEYILCVSGFSKRKNLLRLVQSFKTIQTQTHLVIAGRKGDIYTEIVKATSDIDNISLVTDVSDYTLGLLYDKCLFSIYPSEYEGFGIPILEAFSYGKTVATSNLSSMPEVGGNAATYFNPLKTEEITNCIMELLDTEKRATYEAKIESRLQQFKSDKLLSKYQDIYHSLSS